ncbi:MAG: histidine triad nucleotide-binding protein [Alphaproteobacteria bacterium]|nr:histidine triad nucleotide-binding protein [Alphaproteobacteria bacterium]
MSYDPNNIFARILRGEIPANKVYENAHALAFHDISPQAPVHVLVIPKGAYVQMDEFTAKASAAELAGFLGAVGEVARQTGVDKTGYRLIVNNGENGRQDVPHLHMHVMGGAPLGRMLPRS